MSQPVTKERGIDDATLEMVRELEQSTPEAVKRQRSNVRVPMRAKVIVEAASLSERTGTRQQGVTGDMSSGGAMILTPRPLRIGDVYLLSFDRAQVDLPPAYMLCVRARMVREDAFEAGVKFLSPVDLSGIGPGHGNGILDG